MDLRLAKNEVRSSKNVFTDIFGQEQAIDLLRHDLKNSSIAQSYLFCGPAGIGKTKTAFSFAKAMACFEGNLEAHPDFQLIEPEGNFIGIGQVRRLEHWVSFKASQALRKVAILNGAESLTEEAANALLKTLEEPQENVVFLNITSNINAVLPTIISRCRQVKFRAIPYKNMVDYLVNKGYEPKKVELAAKLSQGVFGLALNLLENDELLELRRQVLSLLIDVQNISAEKASFVVEELLEIIKSFQNARDILFKALDFWWLWLRDLVVWQETGDEGSLVNIDFFDEIQKHCQNREVDAAWNFMQKIPVAKEMIKQNVTPQLILEVLLLEIRNSKFEIRNYNPKGSYA